MKKILFTLMMLVCGITFAQAQAQIKFDKTTHNFGSFSETNNVQSALSPSPMPATSRW